MNCSALDLFFIVPSSVSFYDSFIYYFIIFLLLSFLFLSWMIPLIVFFFSPSRFLALDIQLEFTSRELLELLVM